MRLGGHWSVTPTAAPAPPSEFEPSAREQEPDPKIGESLKDSPTASEEAVVPIQESVGARDAATPTQGRVPTQKQEGWQMMGWRRYEQGGRR